MGEELQKPSFTLAEYTTTDAPYKYLYNIKDLFERKIEQNRLTAEAKALGYHGVNTMYKDYCKQVKIVPIEAKTTDFDGAPALSCGEWLADENGIRRFNRSGECKEACSHPIYPSARLTNIDTGNERIALRFRKGSRHNWREIIVDKAVVSNASSAVKELSNLGVEITSETAKEFVKYIYDVIACNIDEIPEYSSVSRLGWVNGGGFIPYDGDVVFDGDLNYKQFFESVREEGSFGSWLDEMKAIREHSTVMRIYLAASFASVLIKPLGLLPFFVHLWGGTEAGKTVALMVAASVWADPVNGRYMHSFNSTNVGKEKSAAFVNNLPLMLDELQIVKDRATFDKDIYTLSEGTGRVRGLKNGGLDKTAEWANTILTTGEMPITNNASGGGAVNRILEIECKEKLFEDPHKTAELVKSNFGFAGELFVERLKEEGGMNLAREAFDKFKECIDYGESTEKQSLSAAVVLTADWLAEKWVFGDGIHIDPDEFVKHLHSKSDVDVNQRAYEYMCNMITSNHSKFCEPEDDEKSSFECWGKCCESGNCYIIETKFHKILEDGGYPSRPFVSWAVDKGWIIPNRKESRTGWKKRINTIGVPRVVWFRIDEKQEDNADEFVDLL